MFEMDKEAQIMVVVSGGQVWKFNSITYLLKIVSLGSL